MSITWVRVSHHSNEYLAGCIANAVVGEIRPVVKGLFKWKKKQYEIKTSFYTLEDGFKIPFGKKCDSIEEAKMYMENVFSNLVKHHRKPKDYGTA